MLLRTTRMLLVYLHRSCGLASVEMEAIVSVTTCLSIPGQIRCEQFSSLFKLHQHMPEKMGVLPVVGS